MEALVRLFAPDGVYRLAGAPELFPHAVTARGEAEIRRAIGGLVKEFQWVDAEPLDLIVEGDKAARRWRAKVRHIPTGRRMETEGSDVWTFRDGRVASIIQFVDTAAVNDMVGAGEGRAPLKGQASRAGPQAGAPH